MSSNGKWSGFIGSECSFREDANRKRYPKPASRLPAPVRAATVPPVALAAEDTAIPIEIETPALAPELTAIPIEVTSTPETTPTAPPGRKNGLRWWDGPAINAARPLDPAE